MVTLIVPHGTHWYTPSFLSLLKREQYLPQIYRILAAKRSSCCNCVLSFMKMWSNLYKNSFKVKVNLRQTTLLKSSLKHEKYLAKPNRTLAVKRSHHIANVYQVSWKWSSSKKTLMNGQRRNRLIIYVPQLPLEYICMAL